MGADTSAAADAARGRAGDDPLWYKDAIVYQLHVKAFHDSNDDGMGDFAGLTAKLDYVRELGVNTIWLLPFYPSPLRDDGYDVADYTNVHPSYGTRGDFKHFVHEAHRRGLRVITELVVNHTSDQHPWFQAARRARPGSSKRDFYVWSDDPNRYAGTRIIFTDTEKSNWAHDELAQSYYWHRFFSHQPDLNFDNPQVLKAIFRVMRYWLDAGVDGFRLDAIPYLVEREGTSNENLPETHAVLRQLRAKLDERYPGRLLLAEANQWPEDVQEYFGRGDECHMAYHFPLMPRMYMAIAQEDRHPITEIMGQTPDIPPSCQWAIFLRNHDELTLEMVTSRERDYMYKLYAADPRARINLGIRRRLAPLLENDLGRIKLMNSLLFSMPGSPILYYGDEIGMGDNIYLGDRNGVRTPMQWSAERNCGFSRADPQRLYLQPIMDPVYGYEAVNVESQARDPSSLLNWTRRMLAVRKSSGAFGRGTLAFLRPSNRKILAYLREYAEEIILCVANVSRSAQPVELDLARFQGRVPVEMLGRTTFPAIGELPYMLTLAGHGFLWFRLATAPEAQDGRVDTAAPLDLPVLVLFDSWASLFRERVVPWRIAMSERVRRQLETEVLPGYLGGRRWYATKGEPLTRVAIVDSAEWQRAGCSWMFALVHAERAAGEPHTYFMPLALAWEDREEARMRALGPVTLAKVRQQAEVGVLADALGDEPFAREVVAAIAAGETLRTSKGTLCFRRTASFGRLAGPEPGSLKVTATSVQSSNSLVTLGGRLFMKAYRRVSAGVNPEAEIGRYLTDVAGFEHAVPVAGTVEYSTDEGRETTLMLLQGYVENQGDGWQYTVDYLDRFFEMSQAAGLPMAASAAADHGAYLALIRTLGQRTGELHAALAASKGDAAFDPEPLTAADTARWAAAVRKNAGEVMDQLVRARPQLPESACADADRVIALRRDLAARIEAHAADKPAGPRIRVHGDYHLAQVMLVENDFVIVDFEGEPSRSIEERRAKHSPLKDVAGMLRSFDYALHSALDRAGVDSPQARATMESAGVHWRDAASKAFLDGYEGPAAAAGLAAPTGAAGGLLELLILEKALYELAYEIDNRPDWACIPLRGLERIMQPRTR
ncbi:MAG: maltose alpha-D-glucosyltransferase [Usitatibacter sp.]